MFHEHDIIKDMVCHNHWHPQMKKKMVYGNNPLDNKLSE